MNTKFIVVDDDPVSNKICQYTICKVIEQAEVKCFEFPVEGLNFIATNYLNFTEEMPTTLFLDINMPEINGWEFLEEFAKMDERIRKQFSIYIVSTSIDYGDRNKANSNPLVTNYLEKPLSKAILNQLMNS